ncbi:MAG: hypothetical protein P8X79_13460 [Reinekea sp.]
MFFSKIAGAPIVSLKFLGSKEESMDCVLHPLWSHGFRKIAGAPIGSLKFLGSKEESMACALRRSGVTDSGIRQ